MQLRIDRDACAGHGRCYVLHDTLFVDDEAGYGQTIGDGTISTDEQQRDANTAIAHCPERAISLSDDDT